MTANLRSGWGGSEYRFATRALREGRNTRAFSTFIGASCLGTALFGAVVQFHPDGPHGVPARCVQVVVLITSVLVGLRWLRGRWPSHAYAVAYLVWADVALTAFSLTMATPVARVCTTLYMAMLGIFAGFFLGARILYLHCAFAATVIAVIVGWATVTEPSSVFTLFVYYAPVVVWVVLAPMGTIAVIGRGRGAIVRTARSADHDVLTGLRNRRGLFAAVTTALSRRTGPATVVMAVCDIDRFKQLNDRLGHSAGDTALRAMADQLRSVARDGEITARIGGDELVLVAIADDPSPVNDMAHRLTALTRIDADGAAPTSSIGIAFGTTDEQHFSVDDVLRHADAAMYEAKRSGGRNCVVYRGPSTAAIKAPVTDCPGAPST